MAAPQGCLKKRDTERSPISELTDNLLFEIISRVPFKSTCCCKCVSRRWRDLLSHPRHREKMPQTLAGFFYKSKKGLSVLPGYQSVSGNCYGHIDTSLSFLPRRSTLHIFLLDCCNGLLLCRHWIVSDKPTGYVVCNPATEKWVTVPATSWSSKVWFVRLAFDPAVSSHFHVFEFAPARVVDANMQGGGGSHTKAVRIYSSEARSWTHEIVWDNPVSISSVSKGVFFSGMLYLSSSDGCVVAVGMDGNYRIIGAPTPHSAEDVHHVYLSQRQLHLVNTCACELSVWVLENSIGENWTLKHNVRHSQLRGTEYPRFKANYTVISIHPESNVIFIICGKRYRSPMRLMSYEMDSGKVGFICDIEWSCMTPYLSYVPLFSESLADGQ